MNLEDMNDNKSLSQLNKLVCTKDSKCNGWQKSMKQIEEAQSLALAHGISYVGYVFIFCPWCGRKIHIK